MKKLTLMTLALCAIVTMGQSATLSIDTPTYFGSDVFLSDSTSVSLKDRIPTGNVASVNGGIFDPLGAVTFRGALRVETNNNQTFVYKPAVSTMQTGVVINANGYIALQKWVDGTGNTKYTLDPENPPVTTTNGVAYAQGALFTGGVEMTNGARVYLSTNGLYAPNVDGIQEKVIEYDPLNEHSSLHNITRLNFASDDAYIDNSKISWGGVDAFGIETRTIADENGTVAARFSDPSRVVVSKDINMSGHIVSNCFFRGDGSGITNAPYISNDKANSVEYSITFEDGIAIGEIGDPTPSITLSRYASGSSDYIVLTNETLRYTGANGIVAESFVGDGSGLTNVSSPEVVYGLYTTVSDSEQVIGPFTRFISTNTTHIESYSMDVSTSICIISNIPSGTYIVDLSHSFLTSASAGTEIIGSLYVNGIVCEYAKFYRETDTVSGCASFNYIQTFTGSATNSLSYWMMSADASTPTITTKNLQFRVVKQ